MVILGSQNWAVQTSQPAAFLCRTARCETSVSDTFSNLGNWYQYNVIGATNWDIALLHARLLGPEAGQSILTQLANKAMMCSPNHYAAFDIVMLPTLNTATDHIGAVCRADQSTPAPTAGYLGRWLRQSTPTYELDIIELGVGSIANKATALTVPDYLKMTVNGTGLAIDIEQGVSSDNLNTTDSSITEGNYCNIRGFIGESGRAADSERWWLDNYDAQVP